MALQELFARKPVLTHAEVVAHLGKGYSRNGRSQESLLSYHLRKGHLLRVRRGLYAVVPPGSDPESCPVDPYLVAGKLTEDAVLAYHTALEFHGKAYSVFKRYYLQSQKSVRHTTFRSHRFQTIPFPQALRNKRKEHFATKTVDRSGVEIRVASLERTLVDVLDRPDLGGGWEEVWRCLESVEFFDLDKILEYVLLLDNATTAAKVGYFIDQHRQDLMVDNHHLDRLKKLRPKQPHYLERNSRGKGKLVSEWNLVVPNYLIDRVWEEVR